MFCKMHLTSLDLGNFQYIQRYDNGFELEMFRECDVLTINLSSFNTANAHDYGANVLG